VWRECNTPRRVIITIFRIVNEADHCAVSEDVLYFFDEIIPFESIDVESQYFKGWDFAVSRAR